MKPNRIRQSSSLSGIKTTEEMCFVRYNSPHPKHFSRGIIVYAPCCLNRRCCSGGRYALCSSTSSWVSLLSTNPSSSTYVIAPSSHCLNASATCLFRSSVSVSLMSTVYYRRVRRVNTSTYWKRVECVLSYGRMLECYSHTLRRSSAACRAFGARNHVNSKALMRSFSR